MQALLQRLWAAIRRYKGMVATMLVFGFFEAAFTKLPFVLVKPLMEEMAKVDPHKATPPAVADSQPGMFAWVAELGAAFDAWLRTFAHDMAQAFGYAFEGDHAGMNVVVACGVWSPELAELAGQQPPPVFPRAGNLAITGHHATPIRTQLLEISYIRFAHGTVKVDPTRTDDPGGHAVNMQPQTHGGCLIGSTRQFRGMDRTLNKELLHRSLLRAQRYAPGLAAAPIVRTWVGLRPYAIDKHPLIGPWPGLAGLWVAAGHEGLGITLAPITGQLLAQQITGAATTIDPTPYLPARFL